MHKLDVIQTSCMHSIHYGKRSQKRFLNFLKLLIAFFKTLLAAIFPVYMLSSWEIICWKYASKSGCSNSFNIHSWFLHILKTLLAAIGGFTCRLCRVFRDYKTLPEAVFGVKKTLFEATPFWLKIHISMKSISFLALFKACIWRKTLLKPSIRVSILGWPECNTNTTHIHTHQC